ncbi:MAG: hypothetical protein HRU40_21035 [Saprospiraceae bacterium]|nr:hypothetical protein [Saprospiraceae bacterium]
MNEELKILKDKCISLVDFIRVKGGGDMMDEYLKVIEATFAKGSKKGLERIVKDLAEWASGITSGVSENVDDIVQGLTSKSKGQVLEILDEEKITTDSEYQLVLNFVNFHYDDLEERENIKKCNRLLREYNSSEEE